MDLNHPDFDVPWVKEVLAGPGVEVVVDRSRTRTPADSKVVSNSMFMRTLYTDHGIRAQIDLFRPTREPDALTEKEYCNLLSLGDGLDGKTGRAHGGFNALVLDHMTGTVAHQFLGGAPATATLTVDYKATIDTPTVVLCRGWAVEKTGRKVWVKGVIENNGKVLATAKALFVTPKSAL